MSSHELPLVIFSVCAQMSVGTFVVLGLVQLFAGRRSGQPARDRLADPALYAIGPVLVLGLVCSLLHLGSPLRALNSMRHFPGSWLSCEIVFGLAFAVLGAVFAFLQWRKLGSPVLRQILAAVTAVVGLGLVWVMANVYMLPARPAWNSWYTPVSFYCTTMLLGALAVATAFGVVSARPVRAAKGAAKTTNAAVGDKAAKRQGAEAVARDHAASELLRNTVRWISGLSIVVLGIEFVTIPIYVLQLAADGGAGAAAAQSLMDDSGVWFVIRLVLLFIGAGVLSLYLFRASSVTTRTMNLVVVSTAAFILVFVAEFIGRMLFYGLDTFGGIGSWG